VTIEIVPWLTDYFEHKGHGRHRIAKAVPHGTTILDVLKLLAQEQPRFQEVAFPYRSEFNTSISILINGKWLHTGNEMDRQMGDNDVITLLPAFTGGGSEVTEWLRRYRHSTTGS